MKQTESPAIRAIQEIKKAVIGKDDCIIKVMTAILAGGHILIEDVPGERPRWHWLFPKRCISSRTVFSSRRMYCREM